MKNDRSGAQLDDKIAVSRTVLLCQLIPYKLKIDIKNCKKG